MIEVREVKYGVSFAVRVHPRGRKNAITGTLGTAVKLTLTTPPVAGRANAACRGFFAELFQLPRSSVTIAAGEQSRNKTVHVSGAPAAEVRRRLEGALSS